MSKTTGAATLVGSFGAVKMGSLLLSEGILCGGEDSPSHAIYTIDQTTGASTPGPAVTAAFGEGIFGLAPINAASVPEPSVILLVGAGLSALMLARRLS